MQRFATLSVETEQEYLGANSYGTRLLIGTEELVQRHLSPDAVEGRYANGQRYWLLEGFIIFEKTTDFKVNEEVFRVDLECGHAICFNTIEVNDLYAIRSHGLYRSTLKESSLTTNLYYRTDLAKTAREETERKQFEAISEALRGLSVEPTEETVHLYRQIIGFDYCYSYTDDNTVWRRWNNAEKEMDSKLKNYPALADLKKSFYARGSEATVK